MTKESEAFPGNRDNRWADAKRNCGGAHVTTIDRDFRRPIFSVVLFRVQPGTTTATGTLPSLKQESSYVYLVGLAHCLPAARITFTMSDDEFYEYEDIFWIEEPEPILAVSFVPSPYTSFCLSDDVRSTNSYYQ